MGVGEWGRAQGGERSVPNNNLPSRRLEEWLARLVDRAPLKISLAHGMPDDLGAWQRRLRAKLLELLGIDPDSRPGFEVEEISEREFDGYLRRYIRIHRNDGLVVPAFLLLPSDAEPEARAPAVLAMHGHGPGKVVPAGFECDVKGRALQIVGERDYAVQAVQRGYVALAPDQVGFGELMLDEDLQRDKGNSCDQFTMRCFMAGTTTIGQRIIEAMVCFDYLASLPQVDETKLVIMGQSGGGTTSLWTAAIDERVWASVVSCYFCTFRHSILAMYHCTCNYVPGLLEWAEMYDIAALVAPRLLYIINGREDPIFPRDGVALALEKVRAVYESIGASDNIGHYEGPEGHRFYAAEVWEWLAQRL